MKKVLQLLLLFMATTTYIFANINVVVSILPEKTFVEAIGGEKVNVSLMVQPGNSPHTYEPKPSQMKDITKADIYFTIGVEFEKVWLEKFKDLNPKMLVSDLSRAIKKQEMEAHHHHEDEHEEEHEATHHHDEEMHEEHEHDHEEEDSLDPHVWTAPANVSLIASNIYQALSKQDPDNEPFYRKNLEQFKAKIEATDKKIREILADTPKGTPFMVFHPAWGYFATAYGLKQLPVEVEGKEPKPKELMHLMEEAKENKVKAIFTQPEFSDTTAKLISKELGIKVIKASPLASDWAQNLINLANAIAGK
jgi:zinc transport system substrate-binding protein